MGRGAGHPGWTHLQPEDGGAATPASQSWPVAPESAPASSSAPPAASSDAQTPPGPSMPASPSNQAQPGAAAGYAAPTPGGGSMQQDQGGQGPQQPQAMQQQHRAMAQPPAGSSAQPGSGEILYAGTRQHSAALGGYIKWLLVSVAGGLAGFFLGKIDFFATWPLWVLGLVGLPGMLWNYLVQITTKYKVSLRRVEFERGVLSKHVDSLELWRVLDVRYNQNLIDRMLGNAKITLIGTDQSDPELVLYGLPNHRQLFEQLRDAVQAARHTSRPMELVGQDGAMENIGEF